MKIRVPKGGTGGVIRVGRGGKEFPQKKCSQDLEWCEIQIYIFVKGLWPRMKKEEEKKEDEETSFASSSSSNTITSLLMASLFSFISREDFGGFFIIASKLLAKARAHSKTFGPCKSKFLICERVSWYANKLKNTADQDNTNIPFENPFLKSIVSHDLSEELKGGA